MNQRKKLAAYGQEFEDEEEGSIVSKKPTAVKDQIATDENGKRRFHGAFTGGFSAGYWNTVGSRHGWVPQEYSSSRDSRSDKIKQRAEDFMDAEDLGEFGIGNRHIQRTAQFGGVFGGASESGVGRKRLAWERDETSTSAVSEISKMFEDIVKPVSDSIGARMLHQMGWRQGKGIGLSNLKARKGRVDDYDKDQASKIAPNHEFSQEDSLVQQLVPVQGTHGIGYQGLAHSGVLDQKFGQNVMSLKAENNKKGKGIKGQAFGVGVFEEDDDSVYSSYDLSQFDFSLDPTGNSIDDPSTSNKKIDTTFEVQPKRLNARKFYAPPRLPPNFRGEHKCQPMDVKKLPSGMRDEVKTMTAMQRAKFLGEDRVSVMELVSSKDRKRLERRSRWDIKAEQQEQATSFTSTSRGGEVDEENDRRLRNRVEFPEEPMKQARFKEFLHYLRRGLPYPQPTDLSVWEWESEKKEFESKLLAEERAMLPEVRSRAQPLARSAIAAPIHEILASKFVKESKEDLQVGQKDEDKLAAVKMEMFGDRTRQSFEWYPDNLLAKRFNVPHPYPGSDGIIGVPALQKSIGIKKQSLMDFGMVGLGLPNTANELEQRSRRERVEVKREEPEEKQNEKEEDEADEDLAKSSSSSDSEAEGEGGVDEKAPKSFFDYVFGGGSTSDDSTDSDLDSEEEREKERRREKRKEEEMRKRERDIEKSREREKKREERKETRDVVTIEESDEDEIQVLSSAKPESTSNEHYGPAIPDNLPEKIELNKFSVLKYLQEDLKKRREDKKKHKKSGKKSKKHKKEKKSKKKSKKYSDSSEESSWEEEK